MVSCTCLFAPPDLRRICSAHAVHPWSCYWHPQPLGHCHPRCNHRWAAVQVSAQWACKTEQLACKAELRPRWAPNELAGLQGSVLNASKRKKSSVWQASEELLITRTGRSRAQDLPRVIETGRCTCQHLTAVWRKSSYTQGKKNSITVIVLSFTITTLHGTHIPLDCKSLLQRKVIGLIRWSTSCAHVTEIGKPVAGQLLCGPQVWWHSGWEGRKRSDSTATGFTEGRQAAGPCWWVAALMPTCLFLLNAWNNCERSFDLSCTSGAVGGLQGTFVRIKSQASCVLGFKGLF